MNKRSNKRTRRVRFWRGMLACAVSAMTYGNASAQTILRVDANSLATTPNGTTWTLAYQYLQDALDAMVSPSPTNPYQIWVADGTYRPDQGAGVTPNDPTETVLLRDGVAILGGFAGGVSGETTKNARNPLVNTTIITGEIGSAGLSDNTYHIITSIRNDATAVIDGFTIRDGNADNGALAVTHRVGGGR